MLRGQQGLTVLVVFYVTDSQISVIWVGRQGRFGCLLVDAGRFEIQYGCMTWSKGLAISVFAALVACGLASVAGSASSEVLGIPMPLVCTLVIFAMQWLAFVPASLARTEHFYDLWGAVTYVVCVAMALFTTPLFGTGVRGLLVGALVVIWALRLGAFLFLRVLATGGDGRFDKIKTSAPRFLVAWSLQGLWISATLLAALICIGEREPSALGLVDALGTLFWVIGFAIESISDEQKRRFRKSGSRDGFISTGLWAWSRHPNYFGEILLWTGLAMIASTSMTGWEWLGLISPLFVFALLRYGSGIPILEERADQRFGHLPAYLEYRGKTPLLMLLPPQ